MSAKSFRSMCDAVARKLLDEGKLVGAGWHIYRTKIMPPDASPTQVEETRKAFYAGAQHLFASLTGDDVLDAGAEPTSADIRRLARLSQELAAFAMEMTSAAGRG